MTRKLFFAGALAIWIIAACTPELQPLPAISISSETVTPDDKHREYQFSVDTANDLLIEVTGFESEFKVLSQNDGPNQPALVSRIPYLRTGPVYQLLPASANSTERHVVVQADHETNRARTQVKVFELTEHSSAEKKRVQAFRLYSQAIAYTESETPEVWLPRLAALRQAAVIFSDLGMIEQKLWSEFLVAYFTYFPIYNYRESVKIAGRVQKEAESAGLDEIALMAMQIKAQAMLERDAADSPEAAREKHTQAQLLLDDAMKLAGSLDMQFEAAWAINGKGIGFYYQGDPLLALEQYEEAFVMATELQDGYFINMIRMNMALAHERLGQGHEALGHLQEIRQDLNEAQETNLVINNLSEQGRIYKNFYRFPEAVEILTEAQEIARSINAVESDGRIKMSLARAYYEMGVLDRSLAYVEDSKAEFETSNYGRGLREIYQISANIHRYQGNYDLMSANRELQGKFLSTGLERARYAYDLAIDSISSGRLDAREIQELLEQSLRIALSTFDQQLQMILRFELCRFSLAQPASRPSCDFLELEKQYLSLHPGVFPRNALSIMGTWADIQSRRGNTEQAILVYGELLERMSFYRKTLPGVLGAWYWEKRKVVFESYLHLVIEQDLATGDGSRSLVLLDRLRNAETDLNVNTVEPRPAETEKLRGLLARRNRAESRDEIELLEREMDAVLLTNRQQDEPAQIQSDMYSLQSFLADLPSNSTLLAFYFFADDAFRWTANSTGVKLTRVESDENLTGLLERTRRSMIVQGRQPPLEKLGKLGDIFFPQGQGSIQSTIYLLSAGPLNGFPFDTLIVGGSFLAENHKVVYLQSLSTPGLTSADVRQLDSIFLAGNPVTGSNTLPELSATLRELGSIAENFPTAEITLVEGEELQLIPFTENRFLNADLIHIASHSQIDLAYPNLSTIALSSASKNNSEGAFLTPLDIKSQHLSASLVVLSACETTGLNTFGLDANLGFVTAFLTSGAGAVVASLWALPDRKTEQFMRQLYSGIANGLEIEDALVMVKRNRIAGKDGGDIQQWAAFQLYRN